MSSVRQDPLRNLRLLLVLGRVSNLPTVWSNCIAAWWLSGGGAWDRLAIVLLAGTFFYLGGMFLNDAFDAVFDSQYRRDRPIPSGQIRPGVVWQWGGLFIFLGLFWAAWLGKTGAILGTMLGGAIVVYNAVHKTITFSAGLMAACRFLLYLLAGAASIYGLGGWTVWSGLALGVYTVGVSALARNENRTTPAAPWPFALLAAPLLLALIGNGVNYSIVAACATVLVLLLWRAALLSAQPDRFRRRSAVSSLLAGMIIVDLLALASPSISLNLFFVGLFALALLMQRFIPAT